MYNILSRTADRPPINRFKDLHAKHVSRFVVHLLESLRHRPELGMPAEKLITALSELPTSEPVMTRNDQMPKCLNVKMSKCQNAEMSKCQNAKLPKCQNAKHAKMQKC